MNTTYKTELENLQNWIKNINNEISAGRPIQLNNILASKIINDIKCVSHKIEDEYPFYSIELKNISNKLFINKIPGLPIKQLNFIVFGELFVIIKHISEEPVDMAIWQNIHFRISQVSKGLFCDGYYDSAAEKAVKEVESRLRELFQMLKPGVEVPPQIGDIIGALLSEKGAYQFVNLSTTSGKNYRRGIQLLCEGIIAAYRNPAAHENLPYTKREAIEQIILASQLMQVLDKGNGN